MFEHVKIYDWDAVLYTVILALPLGMLSLPPLAYVIHGLRDGFEKTRLSTEDMVAMVAYAIFWMVFLAGFRWAWGQTAFFSIEPGGEWIGRNSCYYALWRIAPEETRQIEGNFEKSFDDNGRDWQHYCTVTFLRRSEPLTTMIYMSEPLPGEKPDFMQRCGYPDEIFSLPGKHGGRLTPPHTWSASGPVFPAETCKALSLPLFERFIGAVKKLAAGKSRQLERKEENP